jgi:hypothetical protein
MLNLLLPALLAVLAQAPPAPAPAQPAPVPAATAAAPAAAAKPLSFLARRFPFHWDQFIPLNAEVDGLKINSIFFNRRTFRSGPLKGADFGTRAQVEVTNTATTSRVPGFAVAVFDAEDRLLGVASGGTTLGTVRPGVTETFDLSFRQVLERLPRGDHFYLSVELTD